MGTVDMEKDDVIKVLALEKEKIQRDIVRAGSSLLAWQAGDLELPR